MNRKARQSEFAAGSQQLSAPVSPVTKTTLGDLDFAETYLQHVARQKNPETRARARVLLATIEMLDAMHPSWRTELLTELAKRGDSRDIQHLFPLPHVDTDAMYRDFMENVLNSNNDNPGA